MFCIKVKIINEMWIVIKIKILSKFWIYLFIELIFGNFGLLWL